MNSALKPNHARGRRSRERGVALMVALVMLVIIGIASVSIMRGALSSDLVANNTRVQTLATQAAQIALRYCEDEVVKARTGIATPVVVLLNSTGAWNALPIWADDASVNTVPAQYMESANSTFVPTTMPQCMAESRIMPGTGGKEIFDITSRGFSPDYSADANGNTASGSAVWLQSTFHL